MRRVAAVMAVAAVLVAAAPSTSAPLDGVTQREPLRRTVAAPLTWVVAGDSYSSGEGTPHTLQAPAQGKGRCSRADGQAGRGTTWGLVAQQRANPTGRAVLVACSGTTSSAWAAQRAEAATAGFDRPDVVTMSFGGNNLGFADVVLDCIIPNGKWGLMLGEGCNASEAELRARVDHLVGNRRETPRGMQDAGTLPTLYDEVAGVVAPGGLVIVAGYPNLTEEPGRWGWRYCAALSRRDAAMLRSVAGYLNQQIALQVQAADARHRGQGVRFEWVDTSKVYEGPGGRHGLCGADGEWLNGLTPSAITTSSFHPKQEGYTALGEEVARRVEAHVFPAEQLYADCLDDAGATYLVQREATPASYRTMTVEAVECHDGWIEGTLVEGSDAFGTVLAQRRSGRWSYVYGAGSNYAVCRTAQARSAPTWITDVLDCPELPALTASGLGPLKVGMSLAEARATGWLGTERQTCAELLEIGAEPGDHSIAVDGPEAPPTLQAGVEFTDDRISSITVTMGASMPGGVQIPDYVGWDPADARRALASAGYRLRFDSVFDVNDLMTATAPDGSEFQIYFQDTAIVGVPLVPICD